MVAKYVRKIEEDGMSINSVPNLWREKVRKQVEADGYVFDEAFDCISIMPLRLNCIFNLLLIMKREYISRRWE